MTREEAIERLKNYTQYRCGGVDLVALNMAIQALESQPRFLVHSDGRIEQIIEPCEDAVSRQALINVINETYGECNAISYTDEIRTLINALPPVLPKREQGEWICDDFIESIYHCNLCQGKIKGKLSKCCPNCGAEMR